MAHEWRKAEAQYYNPPTHPVEVTVPEFGFFVVRGQGDPDGRDFQQAVETLYALAYTVRMAPKSGLVLPGFVETAVYPLEGVWDLGQAPTPGAALDREALIWQAMIRQPDFVDAAAAALVVQAAAAKKDLPAADAVTFEKLTEGQCVQMMHVGPFATESVTFAEMDKYCARQSLARTGHNHREIYLSDPRRTAAEKLKTVLRYQVRDDFSCV